MATCTRNQQKAPKTPVTYDLIGLTEKQAQTLKLILCKIGGCVATTPRGEADAINYALSAAGVSSLDWPVERDASAIYFTDPLQSGVSLWTLLNSQS